MSEQPFDPTPTTIPDDIAEAIAAHALEALPPEEEAKIAAYLAAHPEAGALLAEYQTIVGLLPYAAAPSELPPFLREGVLRSIHGQKTRRRFALPSFRLRFAPVVAACVLLAMLVWNVGLQLRVGETNIPPSTDISGNIDAFLSQPDLVSYKMYPEPAAPNAWGRIYLSPDHTKTAFAISGLPMLPPEKTYQLWFRLPDQTRVSIVTFNADATGHALMLVSVPPNSQSYVSCGITEEPRGGSRSPTGPRVLASQEWPESGYSA